MVNWDTTTFAYQNESMHAWGQAGTTVWKNLAIYNNVFDGNIGNTISSQVFLQNSAQFVGTKIFNNIFTITNQPAGGDGLLTATMASGDISIYNNTFQCAALGSGPPG